MAENTIEMLNGLYGDQKPFRSYSYNTLTFQDFVFCLCKMGERGGTPGRQPTGDPPRPVTYSEQTQNAHIKI